MRLDEIAAWLQLPSMPAIPVTGVSIDSRTIQPGYLFVAVKGEHFDGHDFIVNACQKGAAAILCSRPQEGLAIPQLVMPCTLDALTVIATCHRKRLACEVIAVTGSNGKTTVKEMIAALLPQPAFATPGNLNNHIGVPLSLLQLTPEHRYAVFELGANHIGEIAHTVSMVKPKVTLINNVAPAHLEGFGSFEGVVRAKGEIHEGLDTGGTAVINADDPSAHAWDHALSTKKTVRFSLKQPETMCARNIHLDGVLGSHFTLVTPEGELPIRLRVPGLHNVSNAVAAMTCVRALGLPLTQAGEILAEFGGVPGRLAMRQGKHCARIIDDTYNANLKSVLAALDVLASQEGRKILVLGDLGELGDHSASHHEEIGLAAKARGIDQLLTCGHHSLATTQAFGEDAAHYESQQALLVDLIGQLDENTTVLVKGSRSSAMDRIVQELIK
jgi:UDP-N-acetylmuramoyl-tripeptide--D-alanyl-D-alanine ligase